jgi:hypothetical protein
VSVSSMEIFLSRLCFPPRKPIYKEKTFAGNFYLCRQNFARYGAHSCSVISHMDPYMSGLDILELLVHPYNTRHSAVRAGSDVVRVDDGNCLVHNYHVGDVLGKILDLGLLD